MLTKQQYLQLETIVNEHSRMSAKQLLDVLQNGYVEHDLVKDAFTRPGRNDNSTLHTIHQNREQPEDLTRQKEMAGGFKIRTEAESARADR